MSAVYSRPFSPHLSFSPYLLSASLMALSLAALPAWAQQQNATALDAVTVTATKTPHTLNEVPANVSVITNEDIEERAPSKLDDLLRDLPSVDIQGGPRRVGQDINIRGFGGQRVVTTLDGARQNFTAGHKGRFFLDPELLRQVEVVRGSNSALHGSGAIGGVVSMETKNASDLLNPGEKVGFRGKYGYSGVQRENYYSAGIFGRPDERIDLLANVSKRDSGTLRQGGGIELDNSAEDASDILLKTNLRPTENQTMTFSLIRFKEDGIIPTNPDAAPNATSNPLVYRQTEMTTASAKYVYNNPDMPLLAPTLSVYRNQLEVNEARQPPLTARLDDSLLTTWGYDAYNTMRFNTGSLANTVTFGTEYFKDDQTGLRNNAPRSTFPSASGRVVGVYVQDEIELLRGLTLTPTLRFDDYQNHSDNGSTVEESKLSPKLAANWRPMQWLSLYASYGDAFRAPNLTEIFVTGQHFFGNNFVTNTALKPEKTRTAETGFKLDFKNVLTEKDRLSFNSTYFHTKAEDFIEFIVGNTTTTNRNLTEATIQGVEIESRYDMQYAFGSLGYSRIRGENEQTSRPIDSIPADRAVVTLGGKLPDYGLRFGWRTEIAAEQNRVSNTNLSAGVEAAVVPTSGYVVHGVFATWIPQFQGFEGFRVDAGVENIFDKSYRRHLQALYEEGRDYRVAVSYTKGF
ncbi:TonB-dependent hemoglobin/transferrin/lactoferrin family receptor [Ferrovibrio sp.]|uniref:TonB-dependent hemoglobin/transferrin/lactoferrin family receptor n=1 Tax=Ferrovibrio sp. TaxID=1917215 RepID=UPI0035B308A8